ncbi:phosphonate ABC transporter substrate-binding protein [Rhizobium leguminosarum bv. trifolii CB782]|uniref:Phosphonate ABC transporter substrate-binding protein n=1 Tax=Rhizobium hidalgonense TaxID=1538159 RepID=A0A2A6KBG8_9HYPH|nr:phosphonate ABC transporter substrate-binding protein [Rhizobium hidalgonense]AHG47631.1 phosphonate ABC transporter substrate-binding protein [Rhizobium leguminosarum bv. trifolii CB782]EJC74762.1 phosphonate ABC transporter, periplasmic phosphonate binding protein [Rhizobium leguminosarum bv. trifolii WSM2012]MDR9775746.1 phosphonate ABC transporter substrate-binding protein [Rhizobium hidalgonense]MDR9813721.1 phosphonate ABC transporter substrate-binding protein [Rhizobium hidalgonense]
MLKKALFAATALFALAGGAHAADLKEFRIGILGGENETDRLRNYACLADHLKQEFGLEKVSLFPAADYDGVIQGLLGGTLDFAELGASGYASVYLKDPKAVTPILTTQQKDGSTGYYSIGLALKSSGIKNIKDAKGKKLGYADPDSTSGYLVPLTQIPKDTGMPNDKFFASTQFNGGHENNLLAAYDGKVDVAVDDSSGIGDFKDGYTSGTFRKEVDKGAVDPNKLVEVWRSPLIPNGPLVVRNALGEDWQTKLAAFFTALPEKDHKCFAAVEGGDYKGYAPVKHDFYKAVVEVRKAAIGG